MVPLSATVGITSSDPMHVTLNPPDLHGTELLHGVHIKRRRVNVVREQTRTTPTVTLPRSGRGRDHCCRDAAAPRHVDSLADPAPVEAGVPPRVDRMGGVLVEGHSRADDSFPAVWGVGGQVVGRVEDLEGGLLGGWDEGEQ